MENGTRYTRWNKMYLHWNHREMFHFPPVPVKIIKMSLPLCSFNNAVCNLPRDRADWAVKVPENHTAEKIAWTLRLNAIFRQFQEPNASTCYEFLKTGIKNRMKSQWKRVGDKSRQLINRLEVSGLTGLKSTKQRVRRDQKLIVIILSRGI